MSYVIKVTHDDSLLRLTSEKQPGTPGGLTLAQLEAQVRELFELPASTNLKLTYVDSDDDVVTIRNDMDLKDACVGQHLNPLRLKAVLVQKEPVPKPAEKQASSAAAAGTSNQSAAPAVADVNQPVHPRFQCDGCRMTPIIGHRYQSKINPNYDLCSNCLANVGNGSGEFVLVDPPADRFNPLRLKAVLGQKKPMPKPAQKQASSAAAAGNSNRSAAPAVADVNQPVHHCIQCDGCRTAPIIGHRYQSKINPNYDLCSNCLAKVGNSSGEFVLMDPPADRLNPLRLKAVLVQKEPVPKPAQKQASSAAAAGNSNRSAALAVADVNQPVHRRFQCDGCRMTPIIGHRYQSKINPNYDLCSNCLAKVGNGSGEFVLVNPPADRLNPLRLKAVLVQEPVPKPAQKQASSAAAAGNSNRSAAPAVADVNQPVHHRVQCDGCWTAPIIGHRYQSKIRRNYDLCSNCLAKVGNGSGEFVLVDPPADAAPKTTEKRLQQVLTTFQILKMIVTIASFATGVPLPLAFISD
ncbi:hypothetical protein R1flu_004151 [Riccia fluitans]|uniref:Uncharacterized protein n=1 Tax=Riccia fluitans TaxID=41844 RepID=A0ABD1YPH1_9MARC